LGCTSFSYVLLAYHSYARPRRRAVHRQARKGLGLIDNNLLGLDDTLIIGYTGGKAFSGGYRLPPGPYHSVRHHGHLRAHQTQGHSRRKITPFSRSAQNRKATAFSCTRTFSERRVQGRILRRPGKEHEACCPGRFSSATPGPGDLNGQASRSLCRGDSYRQRNGELHLYQAGDLPGAEFPRRQTAERTVIQAGRGHVLQIRLLGSFRQALVRIIRPALR